VSNYERLLRGFVTDNPGALAALGVMGPHPDQQIPVVLDLLLGTSLGLGEILALRSRDVIVSRYGWHCGYRTSWSFAHVVVSHGRHSLTLTPGDERRGPHHSWRTRLSRGCAKTAVAMTTVCSSRRRITPR
jgi:hypothetical protein